MGRENVIRLAEPDIGEAQKIRPRTTVKNSENAFKETPDLSVATHCSAGEVSIPLEQGIRERHGGTRAIRGRAEFQYILASGFSLPFLSCNDMEIIISEIPAEGLEVAGDFPPTIFALDSEDMIRPVGPVRFAARMFAFEDLITFDGSLRADFELLCVCCLEPFPYAAEFPDWTSDLDLEPKQATFDLATVVREDLLLLLPASPRCDELVEGRVCPKAGLFHGSDGSTEDEEIDPEQPRDVWGALDSWK